MPGQSADTEKLIEHTRRGDRVARDRLLTQHQSRLSKMIVVRMDPRLEIRVDPLDIVQDALIEVTRRLSEIQVFGLIRVTFRHVWQIRSWVVRRGVGPAR